MSTETDVDTSTQTHTETSTATGTETETATEAGTKTGTCSRTAGACAMGAGAAAITCKAMVLGFLASGLALVGLSAVSPMWLLLGVLGIGGAFVWKGFRWAGRRPALLGLGALVTMWVGYVAAGYFVTGHLFTSTTFGMMPAGSILQNPLGLIPVAVLYVAGTALFFGAVYDSYITKLGLTDSKGGMAAGIAGASVCGGCGLTGLAGAGMVLLTGASATNSTKFLAANAVMLIALVGIVAYTLYAGAFQQTVLALLGGVVAFFLNGSMYGFPAKGGILGMLGISLERTFVAWFGQATGDAVANIVSTVVFTWLGLGMMFLALVWAFYPQMELVPPEWKNRFTSASSLRSLANF